MKSEDKLELIEKLEKERIISDKSYAPIIIKTIVFGACAAVGLAFIAWLTGMAWPK